MAKKAAGAGRRKDKQVLPDLFTLIRAAVSVLLLVLAYSVITAHFISILLLIAAIVICGFDIALISYADIRKKDYLSSCLLILIVVIASFCAGCYVESVVTLVVYQTCRVFLDYASKLTKRSAYKAVSADDPDAQAGLRAILSSPEASKNSIHAKYMPYFELFSKAAFIVGLLYAAVVPLISDMSFVMSIRRGCMLVAASIPASALVSLPLCTAAGLGLSAEYGVFIKSAKTLEDTGKISAVIYDKADVFTEGTPKLVSLSSPILDNDTFLQLAAYTAYNSEQRIAVPIVSAYGGDIVSDYISGFRELPGCGMEIKLRGRSVLLGTKELFDARGIAIPAEGLKKGYVLYMAVAGNYAGSISFKENINPYAESVISDFAAMGNIKSILLTDDGREVSERLARALNIDELHYECDSVKKAGIIQQYADELPEGGKLLYVSAENLDYHTAADIDAKVGYAADNADMLMSNIGIFGLPVAYMASKRVKRLSIENLAFTILIKAVLVVLALTGNATIWFIVAVDFAASIAGVLNIARLPNVPLNEQIKEKIEQ